jgi:hypothetical protein
MHKITAWLVLVAVTGLLVIICIVVFVALGRPALSQIRATKRAELKPMAYAENVVVRQPAVYDEQEVAACEFTLNFPIEQYWRWFARAFLMTQDCQGEITVGVGQDHNVWQVCMWVPGPGGIDEIRVLMLLQKLYSHVAGHFFRWGLTSIANFHWYIYGLVQHELIVDQSNVNPCSLINAHGPLSLYNAVPGSIGCFSSSTESKEIYYQQSERDNDRRFFPPWGFAFASSLSLADTLHVRQASISKMERRSDMYISTLSKIIEAMGGELQIIANMPNGRVQIRQFTKIRKG